MSLNLARVEKVREVEDGQVGRCPACAEKGQDRRGEHLRIYPDGRFGCCVHPGDREHRKRIFALVGERSQRGIKIRMAAVATGGAVQNGILGRLGRVFSSPAEVQKTPDAPDGVRRVEAGVLEIRTPRTGVGDSNQTLSGTNHPSLDQFRTPRTPPLPLTRVENEMGIQEKEHKEQRGLKESWEGVRGVREGEERIPHLLPDGTLVIPFDSPERYHWWKGGQSVVETRREVRGGKAEIGKSGERTSEGSPQMTQIHADGRGKAES